MKHKKQEKYEYELPWDEVLLMVDAITMGGIEAMQDGPNTMSQEVVEAKARNACECMKTATHALSLSNDMEAFYKSGIANYTMMYMKKQEAYRKSIDAHTYDLRLVIDAGGWIPYLKVFREHIAQVTLLMQKKLAGGKS